MKYLEYMGILLWTVVRKPVGLVMIYLALPFRAYARNVVYNYVLQNDVYLQRLLERSIVVMRDKYLILPYHGTNGGYIRKRTVSWIEYKLVYWFIWGWLDDDSNHDTFDYSFVSEKKKQWGWFDFVTLGIEEPLYGNSFDLGDVRSENPGFNFWATTAWTWRNTAYNFRYMQWEKKAGDEGLFLVELPWFGWKFGWLQDVNRPSNYSLVFFGWK